MNPFEALADAQMPAPVKRKLDAAEKRRAKALQAEQELKDEQVLSKLYRRHVAAERERLMSGPHGKDVAGIVAFMKTMTLSSAPALIAMVREAGWTSSLSKEERHVLLRMINAGIVKCRVAAGLPELDDALPWEGPKAYHQIRDALGVQ